MKRVLMVLAMLLLAQGAPADEPKLVKKAGEGIEKGEDATVRGIKKGGQAAGRGIEKGVEHTVNGLKKAGEWVGKKLQKGGEKLEGASK